MSKTILHGRIVSLRANPTQFIAITGRRNNYWLEDSGKHGPFVYFDDAVLAARLRLSRKAKGWS